MAITIPMIREVPSRFGNPQEIIDPSWRVFEDKTYECRVLVMPENEGGFSSHALRLPGVVSQGETIEEALDNIADAFRGAVSVYLEDGQPIPWENIDIDRPRGSVERWIVVDV